MAMRVDRNTVSMLTADGGDAPMEFSFVVVDPKRTLERTPAVLGKPCERYEEDGVSIYVMAPWRFDRLPHTHQALDDALEQGALFCNMLQEHLQSPS